MRAHKDSTLGKALRCPERLGAHLQQKCPLPSEQEPFQAAKLRFAPRPPGNSTGQRGNCNLGRTTCIKGSVAEFRNYRNDDGGPAVVLSWLRFVIACFAAVCGDER